MERKDMERQMLFDRDFWLGVLKKKGWPIKETPLDPVTLSGQGILSNFQVSFVTRMFSNNYVDVVLIVASKISRALCADVARRWKRNRLIRPLLIFTDGVQSYTIVATGDRSEADEVRILWLADTLYRTDEEVLESLSYRGDAGELKRAFDQEYLPYEKVRQEFFEGYRDLYDKVKEAVEDSLGEKSSSYAQRFLGRLMFLYFLQRKGWLAGDRKYIDKVKDYGELNRLFYESLNREDASSSGLPFLNGSLFDREEYMDVNMEKRLFDAMDRLFKEARAFFNRYNFTVDELSPLEVEVSIDPALIGTVFENMLPEHERGSKGTFYTPRNEISFICRRALSAYLSQSYRCEDKISNRGSIMRFEDGLERLLGELKAKKDESEVRKLREKLLSLRILDPAVGSGGFLLGMMQEMLSVLREADAAVGWNNDPEEYKKRILPNLYGYDKEAEAVEIARLRLWLSLIIDQKQPEPLPNLDINIDTIKDTLRLPDKYKRFGAEEIMEQHEYVRKKYLTAHSLAEKKTLREKMKGLSEEIAKRTGADPETVEMHMGRFAHIIVMNPPYVRQESIPPEQKRYYISEYKELELRSDLYAYFLIRALSLLEEDGVACVISSDKWLEAGYGVKLQEALRPHLVAVYGQRERSFGADINTTITVYTRKEQGDPIHFVYLRRYGDDEILQYYAVDRKLRPGKWFYLRPGAKFFAEKLQPRLTEKLGHIADIKFGIKTGANAFFYMKDVSHLYEADRLYDPKRFEEWGVKANTGAELGEKGLVYIENEGGQRFVLDRKDLKPIVRSPKQLDKYLNDKPTTLVLYTESPGKYTKKYIEWGEKQEVEERGKKRKVKGYNMLETTRNRNPWWRLPDLEPTTILLPMSMMERLFVPKIREHALCDARLYTLDKKRGAERWDEEKMWLYLNSSVFQLTVEMFCRRLGGGGGASDIKVDDYVDMPFPPAGVLGRIGFDGGELASRRPRPYYEELEEEYRRRLDEAVLRALGFGDAAAIVDELQGALRRAVEDRLVKADRRLRGVEKEGEG